jgi:hypothetical protein
MIHAETGQRSGATLVVISAMLIGWRVWPSAEAVAPAPKSAPAPTYHYVPLLGGVLSDVVNDASGDVDYYAGKLTPPRHPGTCLPFWAPLMAYPHWQFQIAHGASGCLGDVIFGSLAISDDGTVEWTQRGMPVRYLALTGDELERVRHLDRVDCVLTRTDPYDTWFRIGLGGETTARDGALISPSSSMGEELMKLFDDVIGRYRQSRLELLGAIDVRLAASGEEDWSPRTAVYKVRVTNQRVTVMRGRKQLYDEAVDPNDLVDLFDRAVADRERVVENSWKVARGTMTAGGVTLPLAFSEWDRPEGDFLARAIGSAVYEDLHPDGRD